MCATRFLYYFSVYVNLFKELFSLVLNGVFPKSECKGIDFSDTIQIFRELFLKICRLLIQIKRKGDLLGFIGHNGHIRRGGEWQDRLYREIDRIDKIDGDRHLQKRITGEKEMREWRTEKADTPCTDDTKRFGKTQSPALHDKNEITFTATSSVYGWKMVILHTLYNGVYY